MVEEWLFRGARQMKSAVGQWRPIVNRPFIILLCLLLGGVLTAGLLFAANELEQNQSLHIGGSWTTVFTETFEGGISPGWQVTDTDGVANGEYYWAATHVTASQGLTSVWATGGGINGSLLLPLSDNYPNNAASFMIYGPIDLSGTTAVSLTYDYWLESQPFSDTFQTLVSTVAPTVTWPFTNAAVLSGTTAGWQSLGLNLDSYANQPQLWLAFAFNSDAITNARGIFLDNIQLQVQYPFAATDFSSLPAFFKPVPVTPTPIPSPTPAPSPTPTPIPNSGWLGYFNQFRASAYLPLVDENTGWSNGGWLHSRYMVKNNYAGHSEDPNNPWYSAEGLVAAQKGNVFVSSWEPTTDNTALNFWMAAPFHAVRMMDPRLVTTGFGSYREGDGGWQMGATLDVLRGRIGNPPPGIYPLPFPQNGGQTWLTRYNGGEFPDPLTPCPGFIIPTGPGLFLQLGTGSITPVVTAASLNNNGNSLQICVFDETNYTHPNPSTQSSGRGILNSRDAIVIMPRNPLILGQSYTASITVNGQTHTWTFTVTTAPTLELLPDEIEFEFR